MALIWRYKKACKKGNRERGASGFWSKREERNELNEGTCSICINESFLSRDEKRGFCSKKGKVDFVC